MSEPIIIMCAVIASFVVAYAACWIALSQYHQSVLEPEMARKEKVFRDGLWAAADHVVRETSAALPRYHEHSLLPALTLLASQRIQMEPPAPEPEPEAPKRNGHREPLTPEQIENLYDKVKATY